MADTPRTYPRDMRGRFARRPVPDVGAESRYNPMGDDIPFDNESGAPSPSTIEHARYAPAADELAQGGQRSPLRVRHPALVSMDEQARTVYGTQGALTRDAARVHGLTGVIGHVLGVEPPTAPSEGVRRVSEITQRPEAPAPHHAGATASLRDRS